MLMQREHTHSVVHPMLVVLGAESVDDSTGIGLIPSFIDGGGGELSSASNPKPSGAGVAVCVDPAPARSVVAWQPTRTHSDCQQYFDSNSGRHATGQTHAHSLSPLILSDEHADKDTGCSERMGIGEFMRSLICQRATSPCSDPHQILSSGVGTDWSTLSLV